MKVLKKADMIAKNQVTNVKAERAIMMWQGESDFLADWLDDFKIADRQWSRSRLLLAHRR
jgi:serine/threonine-protein kinase RIM15